MRALDAAEGAAMRPWLILAVVAALAASHAAAWRAGGASQRADYSAALAAAMDARRHAEIELAKSAERIAEEAHAETIAHADRLAAADAALDRLRAAVAAADSRAKDATSAGERDAARARALLAECGERYRRLGDEADRARGQLITLQRYVREVCTAPER
jgi:hypothetical protein